MTELEKLTILLSSGLSLPVDDQPEYIISKIDKPTLKALTIPEQTDDVKRALSVLVELVVPNLAKITTNKRFLLIELLTSFDLKKTQFEGIFSNLPELKIVSTDLLLCAYKQHGFEFAIDMLDLLLRRKIVLPGLYAATEKLSMPERIRLLVKANKGGIRIQPADYVKPLEHEDISSHLLMVDDRTTIYTEITRLIEQGHTIPEIAGSIKSKSFKPHILENTLLGILIQVAEENPESYSEMQEIIDSLTELKELHGRSKWLSSISKYFAEEHIPHSGWDEIIKPIRFKPENEISEWFDVLLSISPSNYLKLFDYDGSAELGKHVLFKVLFEQLEIIGIRHRSTNEMINSPRPHDDLVRHVWSNYSNFINKEMSEHNTAVVMSYIKNLALLGDVQEIDKVGQIIGSNHAHQDLPICNFDSFKIERVLGLLNGRKLDQAFEAFTKLSTKNEQTNFLVFSLCRLAREQYRPDITSKVLNLHLAEKRPFDVRTLTIVFRSIRINDLPFLNALYDRLLEINQTFDDRCLHALCEKIRLAGDTAGLATLITKISQVRDFVPTQIYAQLLYAYLEVDEPINGLSVLKRMTDIDGLENIIEIFGSRIKKFDQPIVNDALVSWTSNNEPTRRKNPIKRTYSQVTQVSQIERDPELPRIIKGIYGSTCQLCNVPLIAPTGKISEGAHIHPLGNGHDGPDIIENLLCLCPNHHALLDKHGWYLTDDLGAIETVTGKHLGSIIKADDHDISISCIRYQRRFALNHLKTSF